MKAPLAAASVLLLLTLAPVAVAAGECSDVANKALYTDALAQRSACQSLVGFVLTPPLSSTTCTKCKELVTMTRAKHFGDCTLTDDATGKTTTLQKQMDALVAACPSNSSPSRSGSGSNDIDTPKPTTRVPTPAPTPKTASPSSSGSRGPPVPSPTTKVPSLGTPDTPSPSSTERGSGGGGGGGSKGSGTGSKSRGSGSFGGTLDKVNTRVDAAVTIAYVVGIAAGVVLFVILVATVIVCRQRRKSSRQHERRTAEPFEYADGPTPVSKYAPSGSSGTGGGAAMSSGTSVGIRGSSTAFLNETFLQPHVSGGGLWDDEVIIAARVPREKVLSDKLLSRGGYGEVYRGTYNGRVVAIKTLLPETKKSMKQIHAFLAEVKLMASLEHAQIVRFIGVAWDSLTDLCVLSEFMEGGDLRAALVRFEDVEHRRHGFDHDKVKIALHIAHALTYLHSLRPVVLHRDLKSKNILLDNQLNAKLTDFGVSRERSDRTMTAGVGSSLWMAPEVMLGERYDEKSDIFSFGVVLSELDSHALPYAHVTEASSSSTSASSASQQGRRIPDTAILQMVSLGRLSVQFSPQADPKIVAIARSCVSLDPDARPSAADVLYALHNVLKSY